MREIWTILAVIAGAEVVIIYLSTIALSFFVALKARPNKRALITVGIAYTLAVALTAWQIQVINTANSDTVPRIGIYPVDAIWLALPGAILIYLLKLWEFRTRWVEVDEHSESIQLENDDWRLGLIALGIAILAIVARMIFRTLMHH